VALRLDDLMPAYPHTMPCQSRGKYGIGVQDVCRRLPVQNTGVSSQALPGNQGQFQLNIARGAPGSAVVQQQARSRYCV
jgi:hypothetical protein